ncbi:dual specificity protein phosphatase family protein [Colwellia sp. D2M02]|uniref:diacylglycerol kinase family protein n=1 Tax=Colwellia sp. D2M02 TaxID=2841562 RepID=UPI001C082D8D|nr:diacylglycerol kinase family protein [Colwellia sp. D2M02]MBU2892296.1 dual specificity protein phosphatase family protein [Colwellia sp. D2M02]
MKMIKYYVLLLTVSVFFVWLSFNNSYMLVPSLWLTISLSCVLFAYSTNRPSLFRKSAAGEIPWWIKILLLPYLVCVQLYNGIMRNNDSVPAIQEITPNLFLACRLFPSDIETLKSQKVTAILDVTAEFDGFNWSAQQEGFYYLNIPILDHFSPTEAQLEHALRWITAMHDLNQKVVVHCALGRGRSFFMTCAYLLMSEPELSVRDAISTVQSVRSTARLNTKQLKVLVELSQNFAKKPQPELNMIINPVSGAGKWLLYTNDIVGMLTRQYVLNFHFTKKDTDVYQLTKSLQTRDESMVFVACGGDGTVAEVAAAVKNTSHQLGVLPLGTANALAHVMFGVESKISPINQACEILFRAETKQMDTMVCNKKTVLLVIAIGFGEQMINQANRLQKNELGQLAYIQGFINAFIENKSQQIKLTIDDEPVQQLSNSSLTIANAAPITTLLAQGAGEPNWRDGLLDVTLIEHDSSSAHRLLSLAELVSNTISGDNSSNSSVSHYHAKKILLQSSEGFKYSIDGETESAEQLMVEIMPASLTIIC